MAKAALNRANPGCGSSRKIRPMAEAEAITPPKMPVSGAFSKKTDRPIRIVAAIHTMQSMKL